MATTHVGGTFAALGAAAWESMGSATTAPGVLQGTR
jgi:hypothetical protein